MFNVSIRKLLKRMEVINRPDKNLCNNKEEKEKSAKQNKIIKKTKKHTCDKSKVSVTSEGLPTVTTEDLTKLCDQLSLFNTRVKTIKEVIHLRYELPNKLQEKLEVEAEELESLYRELQDALKHLETVGNQRLALVKEKVSFETQLDKIKSNTVNELELIVSVYDNMMLDRWHAVKNGNNLMAVENLLQDVKGKLQAMKNLQTLVTQKLGELKDAEKKQQNNRRVKELNNNKDSSSLNENTNGNVSQSSFPSLQDTDSDEFIDDNAINGVLYNLVSDHLLALPPWTQGVMDID